MTYLGDTMKSNLKLYEVEFKPELNPLVENLADYLAQCERSTYNDFQYIKHNLSIVVKVPMNQMYVDNFPFNYASIQNENESIFYYYIMDISWAAQNTVALTLGMDTVNTLGQPGSLGHPAMFTDETHIYRQHGDRFYDTGQRDQAGGKLLRRRIDREAEGFDVPKELTSKTVENDVQFRGDHWALMFKTETGQDESPLGVFLVPSQPYEVKFEGSTGTVVWTATAFAPGVYYYFLRQDNANGVIATDDKTFGLNDYNYVCVYRDATEEDIFHVQAYKDEGDKATTKLIQWHDGTEKISWLTANIVRKATQDLQGKTSTYIRNNVAQTETINANAASVTLKTLGEVDHYDPRISKIIKLPYCPIDATLNINVLAIPNGWVSSEGYLKWGLTGLPVLYRNNATNFTINLVDYWYPSAKQSKEVSRESKLYHSELMDWNVVYDSFSKHIALERFDLSETDPGRITVDYQQTNTMGNNLLFKINYEDFAPYTTVENYEEIMLVDRNNEEPIFNSNYLNYLRSGYAYDVASNKIAANRALTEAITGTIGAAANLGIAGWKGTTTKKVYWNTAENRPANQMENLIGGAEFKDKRVWSLKEGTAPIVAQTALGSAMNAVNSWVNYSNLLETQKLQMNAKLTDLQMQSVGVSGSGTIDLLETYNNNKISVMRYEPRLTIKRRLYDFFDYFGYNHDYYEVPNVSSRYWYNYIQCSPILVEEGLGKYKETWLEDLKARYEIGVTVFHDQNDEWNFKRRWENWETWVITE